MEKARVGIIVDSLNSSKQIFDFIEASKNSNNYEISHLIIQKKNKNLIEIGATTSLFDFQNLIKKYLKEEKSMILEVGTHINLIYTSIRMEL